MIVLGVDTSSSCQGVAALRDSVVLAQTHQRITGSHSECLIKSIHDVLIQADLTISALQGLAISIGPGSFTGLRAGLATMMGIRVVTGVPIVGIPTLEAMAWSYRQVDSLLCPMIKAGSEEFYWGLFRWRNGQLVRESEDAVGMLDDLTQNIHEPTLFFGVGSKDGGLPLKVRLGALALEEVHIQESELAINVAQMGQEKLETGLQCATDDLLPRYLLPSYAERAMMKEVMQA